MREAAGVACGGGGQWADAEQKLLEAHEQDVLTAREVLGSFLGDLS